MGRGRGSEQQSSLRVPDPVLDPVGFRSVWPQLTQEQRQGYTWPRDLSYLDLSKLDLSGADLSHRSLYGTDLSDSDLRNANLEMADFTEANIMGAKLNSAVSGAKPIPIADQVQNANRHLERQETPLENGKVAYQWALSSEKANTWNILDPRIPDHLTCPQCANSMEQDTIHWTCPRCGHEKLIAGAGTEFYDTSGQLKKFTRSGRTIYSDYDIGEDLYRPDLAIVGEYEGGIVRLVYKNNHSPKIGDSQDYDALMYRGARVPDVVVFDQERNLCEAVFPATADPRILERVEAVLADYDAAEAVETARDVFKRVSEDTGRQASVRVKLSLAAQLPVIIQIFTSDEAIAVNRQVDNYDNVTVINPKTGVALRKMRIATAGVVDHKEYLSGDLQGYYFAQTGVNAFIVKTNDIHMTIEPGNSQQEPIYTMKQNRKHSKAEIRKFKEILSANVENINGKNQLTWD
jgi:hypothetical protein